MDRQLTLLYLFHDPMKYFECRNNRQGRTLNPQHATVKIETVFPKYGLKVGRYFGKTPHRGGVLFAGHACV